LNWQIWIGKTEREFWDLCSPRWTQASQHLIGVRLEQAEEMRAEHQLV